MIISDNWASYSYEYGTSQRAIISFDRDFALEEEHTAYLHSNRIILYIPKELVNRETGLPSQDIYPEVQAFEKDILESLSSEEVDCKYVGKMIYGGMVDFTFQAEDQKKIQKTIKKTFKTWKKFKLELKKEKGWRFFDEKIRPQPIFWQQIADSQVIAELLKAGSDPEKTHVLEHNIVGPENVLQKIGEYIQSVGLKDVSHSGDSLMVKVESRLDIDEIFRISGFLHNLCRENQIQYDGWGAFVV